MGYLVLNDSEEIFISDDEFYPPVSEYGSRTETVDMIRHYSFDKDFTSTNFNYTANLSINAPYKGKSWGNMETMDIIANIGNGSNEFPKDKRFEDPTRMDISYINKEFGHTSPFNRYENVFSHVTGTLINEYEDSGNNTYSYNIGHQTLNTIVVPSMFNPYFSISIKGISDNIPLITNIRDKKTGEIKKVKVEDIDGTAFSGGGKPLDTSDDKMDGALPQIQTSTFASEDVTDCSIRTLCEMSKTHAGRQKVGGAGYRYADFMYCKDLGKIPNNRMITLRRFAHPVGDNIFDENASIVNKDDTSSLHSSSTAPDMCRLITWFNDENKMDDILKYSFNASWAELKSKIQELPSQEDAEERGILGSAVNLANPKYRSLVQQGHVGSGNKIMGRVARVFGGKLLKSTGTYEGSNILSNYDSHKIYTPLNSVQDTHKYEGKLTFQHEFTLVFNYELKGYQNINPKSAMLDLLANVTEVTFNHGHFWGGAAKVVGAPPNRRGWKKVMNFIDQKWNEVGGFLDSIMNGNADWGALWGSISNVFDSAADIANNIINDAKSVANGGSADTTKKAAVKAYNWLKDNGAGSVLKGMLLNKLGRPALYAFDSLLTGEPVGVWHVTFGNPRNPIMSIGNLIMTNATVQQYGRLGIDDFPTGLRVTCTMKHAKSRDAVEITQMYTKGAKAIYMPLDYYKFNNYYNVGQTTNTASSNSNATEDQRKQEKAENGVPVAQLAQLGKGTDTEQVFGTRNPNQIIFNIASR